MNRDLSIDLEKYEIELKKLYPFLTDEEVKDLLENMIDYWIFVIENSKNFR